ncbi:hypothetical protein [Cuneatibacter caecimuris]|uniref:TrbL/VirB6 plasmid conjugal transfer protein n=1 Tax=Cuneatibacter caecimuris TaxID=1796618 RepID=A0A4Q7PM25_9FIRM|nr:hypothetical protein [Cuneatibacter caecimuris]RZT01178.1 hypothetical protein EV209_1620 [Cuneatibacter caecimuris]
MFEDVIIFCLESGYEVWNLIVNYVYLQLGQSPDTFAGGSLWSIIAGVLPIFAGVAGTLYAFMVLLGFFKEITDARQVQVWDYVKIFAKAAIGNVLILNFSNIALQLFRSGGALIGLVGTPQALHTSLSDATREAISDTGWGWQILLILLAVVMLVVMVVTAFGLLFVLYERFIKLVLIVPLGIFACACLPMGMNITGQYFKNLISLILEGVVIVLALMLAAALANSGFSVADGLTENAMLQAVGRMFEACFMMIMTLGIVKGAQNITVRSLGFSL